METSTTNPTYSTQMIGILSFTLAGLVSGLATSWAFFFFQGPWHSFLGTMLFGLALSIGLTAWKRRPAGKMGVLIMAVVLMTASVVAYIVALYTMVAMTLVSRWRILFTHHLLPPPSVFVFAPGGFVGALVIYSAVFLLFHPQGKFRWIPAKAALWSAGAGALAVVGWSLGPSLGEPLLSAFRALRLVAAENEPLAGNFIAMYVVWQAGAALLLGLALLCESSRQPKTSVVSGSVS